MFTNAKGPSCPECQSLMIPDFVGWRCVNCGVTRDKRRAVRINVEVVYDDGTFEELAFDEPRLAEVRTGWRAKEDHGYNRYRMVSVDGIVVG